MMKRFAFIGVLLSLIFAGYSYADQVEGCLGDIAKRCVKQTSESSPKFEVIRFPRDKGYKLEVLANNDSPQKKEPLKLTTVFDLAYDSPEKKKVVAAINGFNFYSDSTLFPQGTHGKTETILVKKGSHLSGPEKNDKQAVLEFSNNPDTTGKFPLNHFGTEDSIDSYGSSSFIGTRTLFFKDGKCNEQYSHCAPGGEGCEIGILKKGEADYVSAIGFSDDEIVLVASQDKVKSFQQICDIFPDDTKYAYFMDGGSASSLVVSRELASNKTGDFENVIPGRYGYGYVLDEHRPVAYAVAVLSPATHLKLTSPTSNEVIPHSVENDYTSDITWDYYEEKEGELGENVKLEFCQLEITVNSFDDWDLSKPSSWGSIKSSCDVKNVDKTNKQYSWKLPEVAATTDSTFSFSSIEISSEKNSEIKDKKFITFAFSECSYDDVSNAKYLKSVQTLCELGIIKKSDKFRPNDNLTRIEFLKMVLNAKAFAEHSENKKLNQVSKFASIAAPSVIKALLGDAAIISFIINKVTKATRYTDNAIPKLDGTDFEDQDVIEQPEQNGSCPEKDGNTLNCLIRWSFPFVNYAIKTGIMKGTKGGKYKPTENIVRKEAITVLMRALCHKHGDKEGEKESYPICDFIYTTNLGDADLYTDIKGANRSEFFAYIRTAKYAGFLDGYVENNLFKPEQPLKRWEMALSTCRLFTKIAHHKGYSLNNICN